MIGAMVMLQRDDAIIAHVSSGYRLRESPRKVKARSSQNLRLRSPGGVVPVFLALVCLLAGAFHQLRDLQVNAAMLTPATLESLAKNTDTSGKIEISRANVIAEHDKDDSFSVTTPELMIVLTLVRPSSVSVRQPPPRDPDSLAETDTPPPRYL